MNRPEFPLNDPPRLARLIEQNPVDGSPSTGTMGVGMYALTPEQAPEVKAFRAAVASVGGVANANHGVTRCSVCRVVVAKTMRAGIINEGKLWVVEWKGVDLGGLIVEGTFRCSPAVVEMRVNFHAFGQTTEYAPGVVTPTDRPRIGSATFASDWTALLKSPSQQTLPRLLPTYCTTHGIGGVELRALMIGGKTKSHPVLDSTQYDT